MRRLALLLRDWLVLEMLWAYFAPTRKKCCYCEREGYYGFEKDYPGAAWSCSYPPACYARRRDRSTSEYYRDKLRRDAERTAAA